MCITGESPSQAEFHLTADSECCFSSLLIFKKHLARWSVFLFLSFFSFTFLKKMHCALVGYVFGRAANFIKRKKEQEKAPFGVYPWYLARELRHCSRKGRILEVK